MTKCQKRPRALRAMAMAIAACLAALASLDAAEVQRIYESASEDAGIYWLMLSQDSQSLVFQEYPVFKNSYGVVLNLKSLRADRAISGVDCRADLPWTGRWLSPSGKTAVFMMRGDHPELSFKKVIASRDLPSGTTRVIYASEMDETDGVFLHFASLSPDGRNVVFLEWRSRKVKQYESRYANLDHILCLMPISESHAPRALWGEDALFSGKPFWSDDSSKIGWVGISGEVFSEERNPACDVALYACEGVGTASPNVRRVFGTSSDDAERGVRRPVAFGDWGLDSKSLCYVWGSRVADGNEHGIGLWREGEGERNVWIMPFIWLESDVSTDWNSDGKRIACSLRGWVPGGDRLGEGKWRDEVWVLDVERDTQDRVYASELAVDYHYRGDMYQLGPKVVAWLPSGHIAFARGNVILDIPVEDREP